VLSGGEDTPVSTNDYVTGIDLLADVGEIAIVAMPDLVRDVPDEAGAVQQRAVAQADLLHDRLVLLDLPKGELSGADTVAWSAKLRNGDLDIALRAAVAYYPWLSIEDQLGGTISPVRTMPPSGHVAGLISLLDRQRGAHYTPANATLADALDVTIGYSLAERGALNDAGINLLRCSPNQGIQVWGGRTLHPDASWRYVAHRRLIHRLVRAIRRVAEPLTFETNGPALWLTFARAVTTVLVEAYRAGGLQGSRPEEAFRVTCDATNNPPEQIDLGQVVCDIQLAPAVPMEFITLRVVVSDQGALEVFES
jgi:phage tail sheath protein FI